MSPDDYQAACALLALHRATCGPSCHDGDALARDMDEALPTITVGILRACHLCGGGDVEPDDILCGTCRVGLTPRAYVGDTNHEESTMDEQYVRCTECREVSLSREWTPTCPNPACRIGLSAYWDAMKQWRLERDDYIKTRHANANARGYMYASRTVLVDMFKSRNPAPIAPATGRSTTYEMWVAMP